LSALRVGPPAIFGKESLLAKVVQVALVLGVIDPLCDARLAKEIGKIVADLLVPTKDFQAVMHSEQMATVHRLQFCPAIHAIERHHGLRFDEIAYVTDAHKGGFG
jgi:hypothetical protein